MERRGESGFTLIELLVSMGLTMIVMTSVIVIITVFLNDSRYDGLRDQAQNDARTLVDRMTRELRSAAAQSPGSPGLLERANQYDAIFETVNPSTSPQGSNSAGQYRVRYCLNTSTNTLWRQYQTWTTSTPPSVPTSTNCPDTSNQWALKSNGNPCCVELTDVTNDTDPLNPHPMFVYGPSGYSNIDQIEEVQVNVVTDLNPGHLPGPSPQLTSGVFLRNENTPPVAQFNAQPVGNGSGAFNVTLNGSASSDPNGQSLSYQWYANSGSTGCPSGGTTPPSTGALSGGTTEVLQAGPYASGSTETFSLLVTDTQGLTNCSSQSVVMQ